MSLPQAVTTDVGVCVVTVPSAGPSNVSATAHNSTTIHVTWGEVPARHQNGLIRGYKVSHHTCWSWQFVTEVIEITWTSSYQQTLRTG